MQSIVLPYAAAIEEGVMSLDDNARPSRANVVNDWLAEVGIESKDFAVNPAEYAWDALRRQDSKKYTPKIPQE